MLITAIGWAGYLILVVIADANWSTSIPLALIRFGGILCLFGVLIAFLSAMPAYLRTLKLLTFRIGAISGLIQLYGTLELIQRVPNLGSFETSFLIAQFVFAIALFPCAGCLYYHPLFPRWLAIGIALDGVFWICYSLANIGHEWYAFFEILAWGPSLMIEVLFGVYLVRVGLKLRRSSDPID
ncbi:hypothetical protein CKALI_04275 [Corynebacterium kalinowskii]|uniref:DUF4386 domain-containing protein n=2 Tax=Corynebacterium kalinowskii TaxID=2675216 RepID=A0A6B8VJT8_9CORY|nr:hypothetical protein CKALI_04275 [Corynebacterium kalinowskii]